MKTIVNILSLKKVPDLFWTAPTPFTIRPPAISIVFLLLGLIVCGFGHAILFAANLGVSPWMVLSQGITVQTGWSIGWTIIAVSALVLLLSGPRLLALQLYLRHHLGGFLFLLPHHLS